MTEEEMMNPDNWGSSSDAQKACYKQSGMPLLPNGEPDIENFDGNPRWYEELSSCDDYLSNGVNLWDHDTLEPVEYDDDISNNFGYNSQKSYYESKASEGEAPCPNCGNRTFVVPHDAYRSCNICGHSFAVKPTYDIDGNFIVQSKDWTKGNMDWEIVESKADVDLTCGMCNGTGEIYMDTLVTCHECNGTGKITFDQLPLWKKKLYTSEVQVKPTKDYFNFEDRGTDDGIIDATCQICGETLHLRNRWEDLYDHMVENHNDVFHGIASEGRYLIFGGKDNSYFEVKETTDKFTARLFVNLTKMSVLMSIMEAPSITDRNERFIVRATNVRQASRLIRQCYIALVSWLDVAFSFPAS